MANRARTGILTYRRRPRERIKCQLANASNGELTVALALALGGHGDAWLTFARQQPFPPMRAEDLAAAARDYTESVALLTQLQRGTAPRRRSFVVMLCRRAT